MKHYEQLVDMGCFTLADVTNITGNQDTARSLLYAYRKRGLVQSVRRDLYAAMSLETKQPVPNRYRIAAKITDGAYVSHHSAFEVHGVANQVYYEVYVSSEKRFTPFEFDGVSYTRVTPSIASGVAELSGGSAFSLRENRPTGVRALHAVPVRVTDVERTVLDGIRDFEKIGGLEETLNCIGLIPRLDEEKMLAYLAEYGSGYLYQRAGYLLSQLQSQAETLFALSDSFFADCQSKIPNAKRYLHGGVQAEAHTLNRDWLLFVPENLIKGDIYGDDV
jgi:predicted transcriptional regulator of viral defense system